MQGPFSVIRSHNVRDWAQRQGDCHDFLKHGRGPWMDGWWNLHCTLSLRHPPGFDPGPGIGDDPFYRFLQRTWMLQQLPLAAVLFWIGGWPWVIWGICVRVTVGVSMHWFVGYLCHTHGQQSWFVDWAQRRLTTYRGRRFRRWARRHNNHHAFQHPRATVCTVNWTWATSSSGCWSDWAFVGDPDSGHLAASPGHYARRGSNANVPRSSGRESPQVDARIFQAHAFAVDDLTEANPLGVGRLVVHAEQIAAGASGVPSTSNCPLRMNTRSEPIHGSSLR